MMLRPVAVGAVAALALLACSDSGPGTSPSSTTSSTSSSTSSSATITVQVFFLDQDAFNVGRPPYTRPVERTVDAADPARGALRALFDGPTSAERAGGLLFVGSGALDFADLNIVEGTATVRLVGGCSSGGSTFTIADEIGATLRQFSAVQDIKILDPEGNTERPDEPGDSIPFCLEP